MTPEEAAAEARRRATEHRGEPELPGLRARGESVSQRLARWAFIDVDPTKVVRSTRPGGRPITWLKRRLLRLLGQYLTEQEAQATRFNLQLLGYVEQLEARIADLEAERDADDAPPRP
ncbi:MAG: hypothetical protein ACR2NA_02865 [Solirubrobacterales bacterium]